MKHLLLITLLAFGCLTVNAQSKATKKTTAKKTYVKKTTKTTKATKTSTAVDYDKLLVGDHMFSSQWISWKKFGKVTITKTDTPNVYKITGKQDGATCSDDQDGRDNGDYLTIEGTLTPVSKTELIFEGKIVQKAYCVDEGEPCPREGKFTFKATDGRRYWRLQEMRSPCDNCVDYIDIFFK